MLLTQDALDELGSLQYAQREKVYHFHSCRVLVTITILTLVLLARLRYIYICMYPALFDSPVH